jgi:GntR family transcriptional repressor for pyruvate dehydrogenase complex
MDPISRRNTLANDVMDQLRKMIIKGDLPGGEFLPSRKSLAQQFGVGLSTIHEALQALTALGMVESYPGKGTWVREEATNTFFPTSAIKARLGDLQAHQVYETRSVIEVALTEFAARRATEQEIEEIWAALRKMQSSIYDDDSFVQADMEFHMAVAKASHNTMLGNFYHLVREMLVEVISEVVKLPSAKEDAITLQQEIVEAIQSHDPQLARQVAIKHLKSVDEMITSVDELETHMSSRELLK